eukprot:2906697-Rhodomonas_salina.1
MSTTASVVPHIAHQYRSISTRHRISVQQHQYHASQTVPQHQYHKESETHLGMVQVLIRVPLRACHPATRASTVGHVHQRSVTSHTA